MKKILFLLFCCTQLLAYSGQDKFNEYVHIASDRENLIGTLKLDGNVNLESFLKLKFGAQHFKNKGAKLLIIEMDTQAGRFLASQKIAQLLQKTNVDQFLPTLVFINEHALGPSCLIPLSSRFIAMTPSSLMGGNQTLKTDSKDKFDLFCKTFEKDASFFNRNSEVALAMVDPSLTTYNAKGDYLLLDAKEMMEYEMADWEVSSIEELPFLKEIPNLKLETFSDWSLNLIAYSINPAVMSMLLLGFIIGAYIAIHRKRFGVFSALSLFCLFILLYSSLSVELASVTEMSVIVVGLVVIFFGASVLPAKRMVRLVGALITLLGMIGILLPGISNLPTKNHTLTLPTFVLLNEERISWLVFALFTSVVLIYLLGKHVFHRLDGFDILYSWQTPKKEK